MKKFFFLLSACCLFIKTFGQNDSVLFIQVYSAKVNGEVWNNAFYGSTTQLAVAFGDLDGDGDFDLIQGSRWRVEWLRNNGTSAIPAFEDLNWGSIVLNSNNYWSPCLIDIDNDNDLDLFCGKMNGTISLFENTGTHTSPVFDKEASKYAGLQLDGHIKLVYCDINYDGDYDLFIGDDNGNVHFYSNEGTPKVPDFKLITNSLVSSVSGTASPEFVDIDNDNDFDLMISASGSGTISYYENIGSNTSAVWKLISNTYNDVDLGGWCDIIVRFCDIDNDNDFDMFITDFKGYFYFYENTGDKINSAWQLKTSLFNKILNFGRDSAPASGDIDDDGDMDIVFGTTTLENIGSNTSPEWEFNDQLADNPDNLFDIPTLFDIDGDNDLDLFIGKVGGTIELYENISSPSVPVWQLQSSQYNDFNFGENSHPSVSFTDIDGDRDCDMFVQHCNWNDTAYPVGDLMSYYFNIGDSIQPHWILMNENYLGLGNHGIRFGRCSFGDIDNDNDYDCFCGAGKNFYLYSNLGDKNVPLWIAPRKLDIGVENESYYASPILVDLNDDLYPEILAGHDGGGLNMWWNMMYAASAISENKMDPLVEIYPNPFREFITINAYDNPIEAISVLNIQGKILKNFHINNTSIKINLDFIDRGTYILEIKTARGISINKIYKL